MINQLIYSNKSFSTYYPFKDKLVFDLLKLYKNPNSVLEKLIPYESNKIDKDEDDYGFRDKLEYQEFLLDADFENIAISTPKPQFLTIGWKDKTNNFGNHSLVFYCKFNRDRIIIDPNFYTEG